MLYIILHNAMVVTLAILMIVAALILKRPWKWIFSPILLVTSFTAFIIPNINYFQAPFAAPLKLNITENGKPIAGIYVITARGLEFTSFFSHIPSVTWRDVDLTLSNSKGEIEFGRKLKYMTIDLGIIGRWYDNNNTFYSCVKSEYRYISAITSHINPIYLQVDKNIKGTGYYDGINLLRLDRQHIMVNFSAKAKSIIDSYLINNS